MYLIPKRKTSHILHLFLTILTAGMWILPWIAFTLYNNSYNLKIDLAMVQNDDRRSRASNRRQRQRICTCEDSPHTFCEACGH